MSTDSAAEGLNLHQRCHHLLHLELPFNPNRLEQRNGRIDRYGQTYEPHIRYLFLRSTFEERILLRLIAKYEKQRARLTFVPNTLGIGTSTDAVQAKLLKGLLEEDGKLFKEETPLYDLVQGDEDQGTDDATKELLQEIDRSLRSFRQAARSNEWLGDAGLNAEQALREDADRAAIEGRRAEEVDLPRFVRDAVLLDGGKVKGDPDGPYFALTLPPQWTHGLADLPGYDADRCVLRLTTNLDIMTDEQERSVGFLGRAHPLVRRALDRVRNLSFGKSAASGQDPRATVVKASVSEPALLFTFIGRVTSPAGREFERVLAVRVSSDARSEFHASADQWLHWADPAKGIRTTDVWKDHFEGWAGNAVQTAHETALRGFGPVAEEFIRARKQALSKEASAQKRWLTKRAEEITGSEIQAQARPVRSVRRQA